jgi:GDP-D-mannose 3',5'-epimerase
VAQAKDGDTIIIWGDGLQTRSYLNVDECLNCVFKLMDSDVNIPLNIGSDEMISCNDLAKMVIEFQRKDLKIEHDLTKPQGVRGRNSDNTASYFLNWGYAPQSGSKKRNVEII